LQLLACDVLVKAVAAAADVDTAGNLHLQIAGNHHFDSMYAVTPIPIGVIAT
jgi:predicted urease superfamily metal-dependent hydrolase